MASKVALVTGANQGIGYAIVRRLCKEHPSYIVYGTSRSLANGEEAERKLKEEGFNPRFVQADLTDEKSFVAVKEMLLKEHGGLDILVNNAGIAFKQAATDPYAVKADVTLNTNVFGTNMVCQQLMPILRDGARIVILSSFAATMALKAQKKLSPERYARITQNPPIPMSEVLDMMKDFVESVKRGTFEEDKWPNDAAYFVSKLGNTMMARALNAEFSKQPERDIVVNAADPGYVSTSMTSHKGHSTIDEGADTPYYLATLPPSTPIKGQHVAKRKIAEWS